MIKMIERVARAMYDATPFKETEGGYDEQSETYRRMCEVLARAAIETMREPPETYMARNPPYWLKSGWYPPNDVRKEIWQQMIDEALTT